MKSFLTFCLMSVLFSSVHAQLITLPNGLAVDPDNSVDVTYQLIPDLDEREKVIAGWSEDKLQYAITVEKLPPGWHDPLKYFQGVIRDFRAAGRKIDPIRSGEYISASGLNVTFVEFKSTSANTSAKPVVQIMHFLSDGKTSFNATATLLNGDSPDSMLKESMLIFQSARLSDGQPQHDNAKEAVSPYIGNWKWSGLAPDGSSASATITLEPGYTFATTVNKEGVNIFTASGVWEVTANKIFWTYMYSNPMLPKHKNQDEDEILSVTNDRLMLRSSLTGQMRELVKSN